MSASALPASPARAAATRSDSSRLLRGYAQHRDPADLERLVLRFRPLARKLALRYARGSEPLDDLEQVACLGLVKAIERFDPARGFAFTSFAVPTILGELKRSFRDTAWSAHVPRAVQERVAEMRRRSDELASRAGRGPTIRELATAMGCGDEEVVEAMTAAATLAPLSLDGRAGAEEDEGAGAVDQLGEDDPGYELIDDRCAIEAALPALTDVQRTVLRLRFDEGLKQSEIAQRIGVSQMQVSRVLRAALQRLSTVAGHHSG
jgi:RNA polymerase sigma-B factor